MKILLKIYIIHKTTLKFIILDIKTFKKYDKDRHRHIVIEREYATI
jgi:hypothetical protein